MCVCVFLCAYIYSRFTKVSFTPNITEREMLRCSK